MVVDMDTYGISYFDVISHNCKNRLMPDSHLQENSVKSS